jgi:lysozyme
MDYSKQGLTLTEGFESCRLTAYQDVKGIWTCGWGHVGPEVVEGFTMTQNQADSQLILDLTKAEGAVNHLVTVPMSQGEYDSLVDFCYNCGTSAFAGSSMLKLLNAGDYQGAAAQFELWDHAAGKVVAGLLRRRQAEEKEFTNGN